MVIPLKREPCDEHLAIAMPSSLREKVRAFAIEEKVTESAAARHILSLFFDGDLRKIQENLQETIENDQKLENVNQS